MTTPSDSCIGDQGRYRSDFRLSLESGLRSYPPPPPAPLGRERGSSFKHNQCRHGSLVWEEIDADAKNKTAPTRKYNTNYINSHSPRNSVYLYLFSWIFFSLFVKMHHSVLNKYKTLFNALTDSSRNNKLSNQKQANLIDDGVMAMKWFQVNL